MSDPTTPATKPSLRERVFGKRPRTPADLFEEQQKRRAESALAFQDAMRPRDVNGEPIGWAGTQRSGGQFTGPEVEHNQKLDRGQWRGDVNTVGWGRRMTREDDTVRGIGYSYTRAHLGNSWDVRPPTEYDEDPEAQMIAHAAAVLTTERPDWNRLLLDALLMYRDGVRLQERTVWRDSQAVAYAYQHEEGQWKRQERGRQGLYVFDLFPRLPHSIDRWITNPDGGFGGIIQFWRQDDTDNHTDMPTVPADNLVRFTFDEEGTNWEGDPLIRGAYGSFISRKDIRRNLNALIERCAIPIPVVTETEEGAVSKKHWDTYKEIAYELRGSPRQFVAANYGAKIDWLEGKLDGAAKMLDVYNIFGRDMARGTGCMHLYTGENTGISALFSSQRDLFLYNAQSLGEYVCDGYNALLADWTRWNGWDPRKAPHMVCGELASTDLKTIAEGWKIAKDAGVFHPSPVDETFIRDKSGSPPMSQDVVELWGKQQESATEAPSGPGAHPSAPVTDGDGGAGGAGLAASTCHCGETHALAYGEPAPMIGTRSAVRSRQSLRDAQMAHAEAMGPMFALAETYFAAQTSRVGREDNLDATVRGSMGIVRRMADDYAERLADADTARKRAVLTVDPKLRAELQRYLRRRYNGIETIGRDEVKRETKEQRDDPAYPEQLQVAIDEQRDADPMAFATIGKKGKKSTTTTPLDDLDVEDHLAGAAMSTVRNITGSIQDAGQSSAQSRAGTGTATSGAAIATDIMRSVRPSVVKAPIQQDTNDAYGIGRAVQMRREDVEWELYSTTPELSSQVCEVCADTEADPRNPHKADSPDAADFVVPNPGCLGTLGGSGNPCWCAKIGLTRPEGVV